VDLSIVIVNWNTRDLLRACLSSLVEAAVAEAPDGEVPGGEGDLRSSGVWRLASGVSFEVIVVDNASADGSAAMVREQFPGVQFIANATNRGYAAANNQGLAIATGEFLMLLNPDTEVSAEALEALIGFLRERPAAGAVAPRLVHADGRVQESVRGFPTPAALLGEVTGMARLWPKSRWGRYRVRVAEATAPLRVDQPMASCFLMRREALAQVGPMDEQFPIFFNDVDLCYRLSEAGWEIWYLPAVRVLHHGGASTRQVRPAMIRESHRSLHRFYRKHFRRRLPAPLYAAIVGAIYLLGAARTLKARIEGAEGRDGAADSV
jgi:GT2 family glycosyltransferase